MLRELRLGHIEMSTLSITSSFVIKAARLWLATWFCTILRQLPRTSLIKCDIDILCVCRTLKDFFLGSETGPEKHDSRGKAHMTRMRIRLLLLLLVLPPSPIFLFSSPVCATPARV